MTYCNQIVKSQRQRETFESRKRKATHHIQGDTSHPHKAMSRFLGRNLKCLERVVRYIQNAKENTAKQE